MVLACEIKIENEPEEVLVLLPNALYILPDDKLAKLSSSAIWCDDCKQFGAGELVEPLEDILKRIEEATSGQLDERLRFVLGTDREQVLATVDSWNRQLHWRRMRISPPKCLDCGSMAIRQIDANDAKSLIDPRSGKRLALSYVFASTSIDHRLSLYTSEGEYLGEISRLAPRTHEYIDDRYPYSLIVSMLESQRQGT